MLSGAPPNLKAPAVLKYSCQSMVTSNCPRRDEGRREKKKLKRDANKKIEKNPSNGVSNRKDKLRGRH